MPTYEYQCDACDHRFDELQSFSEPVLTKCPECGKKKLRRLFGAGAAVLFKGSGFYETDYRSESYKQASKAESEAASKTDKPAAAADGAKTDAAGESSSKATKSKGKSSKSKT